MKIRYMIISFLILSGCKNDLKPERITRTFNLINNIGSINIDLTNEFDTLHSWTRNSDYLCGTEKYYRCQSSKFPMLEEAYFSNFPDSLYGITISHKFYPECVKNNKIFQPNSIIENLKINRANNVGIDNLNFKILRKEEIRNFQFVIYATLDTTYQNIIEQHLGAVTFINNYYIRIDFLKTSTHLTDTSFIWDSYDMLKTIKIRHQKH